MAGNTKMIRRDANSAPAPQYFNSDTDAYEYLQGEEGASKIMAAAGAIVDLKSALDELIDIRSTSGIKQITDALPEGTNEIGKAVISGDETLISGDPVSGTRTLVPGVAAEIFGGASAKSGRVMMSIKNTSTYAAPLRCRIGESSITAQKGLVLEPQATLTLFFNPKTATAVYAIPETNELKLEVTEA